MTRRFYQNPVSRSLGLHLLIVLFALLYANRLPNAPTNQAPIDVSYLSNEDEKPKAEEPKQMVVKRSAGEETNEAKKNAYLSDKTRVVKEERSARNSGEYKTAGAPAHPQSQPKTAQSAPSEKVAPVTLGDLGVKIAPKKQEKYTEQRNWANTQTGEALKGGQYMQGMKEGESSALNTKEFVFFSYFDRVRKQLDQAWQPILRENIAHIFKVGRRIASNTDFVTKTLVTLNQKGEIVKVQVLEESGTHDLDQAAVDALNKAGPYPNPPHGLVDGSGQVSIRWDFILKT